MKIKASSIVEDLALAALVGLNFCTASWGGFPPLPPSIPSTPVGGAGVSAVTVVVVAGYGFWKMRK